MLLFFFFFNRPDFWLDLLHFMILKTHVKVPADLQGGQNNLLPLATVTCGPVLVVCAW